MNYIGKILLVGLVCNFEVKVLSATSTSQGARKKGHVSRGADKATPQPLRQQVVAPTGGTSHQVGIATEIEELGSVQFIRCIIRLLIIININ